ncbi:hypothetical protein ACIBL6_34000 [Streptomyces sp. NPDC050400]|uniref:hypothetical protein n=1 Tax=Streptomyces sp. NPDC050400 TaxID=3365610 RepID=UPI0037B4D263
MRATRRTFRTAAIATGAIAALAVPATAAFADTTPQPVASDDQSQNQDQNQNGTDGQDQATPDQNGTDQNGTDNTDQNARQLIKSTDLAEGFSAKVYSVGGNGAEADIFKAGALVTTLKANGSTASTTTGGYVFQLTPDGQLTADQDSSGDPTQPPVPGGWESKGTTDLGHGWTADVKVNASARTAKADISRNGTAKGHLTAYVDDATKKIDGYTFTLTSDGKATAKKDAKDPVVGGWESKGVQKFADGWSAKVQVNASARAAKADISHNGTVKGHLTAFDGSKSTKIDNYTFTLTSDGKVTAKKDAKPAPDHKRQYVKTVRLADGVSVAKVYKLDTCHYQADVYAHGQRIDTLDANNRTAYGQNNGLHVALKPNGNVTSWLDAAHKKTQHTKPAPQTHSGSGTGGNTGTGSTGTRTLPQGGVKAGAENVSAHTSGGTDSTPLIAAGAGAAAVGAAGLGFAMYRRKNHN